MITAEKIASIKRRAKNGEPAGELRAELEREGYSKEEIGACFPAHNYNMSVWYLVSGILLFVWGVVAANWLLLVFSGLMLMCYYFENLRKSNKK